MRRLRLGDVKQERELALSSGLSHKWVIPVSPVQNCFFLCFRLSSVTIATVKRMVRVSQNREKLGGIDLGKEASRGFYGVTKFIVTKLLSTTGMD